MKESRGLDGARQRDRRAIRIVLVLVAIGWAAAVALMALAATFWDHPSA